MTSLNDLQRRHATLRVTTLASLGTALLGTLNMALAQPSQMPVTPEWRDTAQRVAQAGVQIGRAHV